MGKIVWRAPGNLATLVRMLTAGASASEIGAEFSSQYQCKVTKNAIIGIVHRLTASKHIAVGFAHAPCYPVKSLKRVQLKRLQKPKVAKPEPVKTEVVRRGKCNQPEVVLWYEPEETEEMAAFNWSTVEGGQATQLSGLNYKNCRWPVHGDTGRTFLFCGGTRSKWDDASQSYKSPYCHYHAAIACRPPPDPNAPRIHPSRRRKQGAGGAS